MHLKRWLTAIVLIPIVASVIYFSPPWFFALFICGVCMVALYEYYGIVLTNSVERGLSVTRGSGFIVGVAIVWSGLDGRFDIICLLICGLLILDGAWALNRYQESSDALETVLKQVTGTVYLALALALAVAIHQKPHGPTWIYFFLIVIFLGDTGAYYAGNYYGRHKLLAAVSPGKTWEGSLGGMAATVASGCLINLLLPYLPFYLDMPR